MKPAPGILLKAPRQQASDTAWRLGWQQPPRRFGADHGGEGVRHGLSGESGRARQHLEEHTPERPDIGTLVDQMPSCLLRAHVCGGTENHAGERSAPRQSWGLRLIRPRPFRREGLCEPEVEHLDHSIARDLDVGGFEIAMDDPGSMGSVERVGDLLRDG